MRGIWESIHGFISSWLFIYYVNCVCSYNWGKTLIINLTKFNTWQHWIIISSLLLTKALTYNVIKKSHNTKHMHFPGLLKPTVQSRYETFLNCLKDELRWLNLNISWVPDAPSKPQDAIYVMSKSSEKNMCGWPLLFQRVY